MPPPPALPHVETWVFDLDNTLYPRSTPLIAQIDRRITAFVIDYLRIDHDAAQMVRKQYLSEHGTTLRGLMVDHGLHPDAFLDYVHDVDHGVLPPAPALDRAIAALDGRKLIFTNGTRRHAERVLDRLGIAHHFEAIFDVVAADYRPKPDPAIYHSLVERHRFDPRGAVMIEDLARNLAPAAALGMTTVLVHEADAQPQAGAAHPHVHFWTDDLVDWLDGVSAARRG